jgi:outer membrane immunogenic protein
MWMRNLTGACALQALAGGCALAAGVVLAEPVFAAEVPAPVGPALLPPTWTGFYAGVHLGARITDPDSQLGFTAFDCGPCASGRTAAASFGRSGGSDTSVLGGAQAGYRWKTGTLVYGLETDFSLRGNGRERAVAIPSEVLLGARLAAITEPGVDGFNGRLRSSLDWLATARASIGVTTGSLLFYATGGVAFAEVGQRASFTALVGPDPGAVLVAVSGKNDDTRVGWTVGAGVEAMLGDRLSVKLEYDYADLGKVKGQFGDYLNITNRIRQSVNLSEDVSVHAIKVGLNYRFMGP